jgi:hypothetical protein
MLDDGTLHKHHCENTKSYISKKITNFVTILNMKACVKMVPNILTYNQILSFKGVSSVQNDYI